MGFNWKVVHVLWEDSSSMLVPLLPFTGLVKESFVAEGISNIHIFSHHSEKAKL